jgi:Tfp pilus assembly protein PilF
MKFASKILSFLFIAMLFAIPAYAQTGSVGGKVVDAQGQPIAGATVSIDRQGVTQHFQTETKADGSYFHAGLPIGRYKVSVIREGRTIDFVDGLNVGSGATTTANFDPRDTTGRAGPSAEEAAKLAEERAKAEAVKASFDQGIAAMTAKNFTEAARLFQEAATQDPTQHVIFGNLGGALSEGRKYDEAAAAYQKAIELKPDEAAYYNNLGVALGSGGKIDEAVQALQKAAELNPANAGQSYYNLGAVLTNRGRTADAVTAFKKAIEYNPDMGAAYYQLAISYFGSPATMPEAIPALEKFLQLEPNSPDAEAAKQLIEAAKASAPTGFSR